MSRQFAWFGWLALVGCAGQQSVATPTYLPAAAPEVPTSMPSTQLALRTGAVTVAIVVDQFAAWIARERLPMLPATGGFARLTQQGAWYKDMRFAHAITETAAGHASLYTGKVPHEHGIVANDVWAGHGTAGILTDATTRLVTAAGIGADTGASAAAIHSDMLADRLKKIHPTYKVFSFSLKDRGAIVAGGRQSDLTLWYEPKLGQFVTSTAFAQAIPDWANSVAGPQVIQQKLNEPWVPLDAKWLSQHSLTRDVQVGESDYAGYGLVFPHIASHCQYPLIALRVNPTTDRILLDLGLQAVRHVPDDSPVFLALSLSANDYVGHLFGPDSWEAWDELRRLDAALADFFVALDALQGPNNWSLVLSADHGVLPLPEVNRALEQAPVAPNQNEFRPRDVGGRILPRDLEKIARDAAGKVLGKGDWIAAVVDPYLYYSDAAKQLPARKLSRLHTEVSQSLAHVAGVRQVFDVDAQPDACPPDDDEGYLSLICRAIRKGIAGDVYISLEAGYFFDTGYMPGFGTSHGNVAVYDRSVPLIVRAPGRVKAGEFLESTQSFVLFAQTLSQLLDLN